MAIAAAGLVAFTLAACGGEAGGQAGSLAEMDPVTVKWRHDGPENATIKAAVKEIEEKTDGKVQIDVYWSSSLLTPEETLGGIRDGVADISSLVASYYPQELPVANWHVALASGFTESFPGSYLQSTAVTHEAYMTDPALREELSKHNLVPLTATAWDRSMMCTEPVSSLADAKGKRVRSGGVNTEEVKALGMTETPISTPEVYDALNRGILDCAVFPAPSFKSLGIWEVAQHFVPAKLTYMQAYPLVINKELWDSFPAEVQEVFKDAALTFMKSNLVADQLEKIKSLAVDAPKEHGVEFHDPTALNEVLAEFQAKRLEGMAASAPDSLTDPEGFIDRYRQLIEKWNKILTDELTIPANDLSDPAARLEAYEAAPETSVDEFMERVKTEVTEQESE